MTHPVLLRNNAWREDIHVECEGNVLDHIETVCHGDPGQDEVDWIGAHILLRQHQDVEKVKNNPNQTDTE